MSSLRPVCKVIGLERVDFLLAFAFAALSAFHSFTIHSDAEWREFLGCDELIGHHVGTANLEPALYGIIFSWNQLNHELGLTSCWAIASLMSIQVVTYHAMLYIGHVHIAESGSGVVADAGFEALRGRKVHVLRVSHRCTVDYIVIGECLVNMLVDLCAPDAIAVTLHSLWLGEYLCSQ